MPAQLSWNRYGKSSIRLVRSGVRLEPRRIVDPDDRLVVALEGGFDRVYTGGDNSG